MGARSTEGALARFVYLGTPQVAVGPLRALVGAGHEIALVVSQPDRRRGRGSAMLASPVKAAALELGLPVGERVADVVDTGAELGVVVAFGRLVRPEVLERVPMVNLHFSLLPRWRGAAPVERAVLAGDDRTGVCLMALEEGLDTGGVYERAELPIGAEDDVETLRQKLADLGTEMLLRRLVDGRRSLGRPEPQSGEATYAEKIRPEELELHWEHPADQLARVTKLGGAWTRAAGRRLRVWQARPLDALPVAGPAPLGPQGTEALPGSVHLLGGQLVVATGRGFLVLEAVQPEGRGRMPAVDWWRGARLGDPPRLGA